MTRAYGYNAMIFQINKQILRVLKRWQNNTIELNIEPFIQYVINVGHNWLKV